MVMSRALSRHAPTSQPLSVPELEKTHELGSVRGEAPSLSERRTRNFVHQTYRHSTTNNLDSDTERVQKRHEVVESPGARAI